MLLVLSRQVEASSQAWVPSELVDAAVRKQGCNDVIFPPLNSVSLKSHYQNLLDSSVLHRLLERLPRYWSMERAAANKDGMGVPCMVVEEPRDKNQRKE